MNHLFLEFYATMAFINSRLIHAYSRLFFSAVLFVAGLGLLVTNVQAEEDEATSTMQSNTMPSKGRPLTDPSELQRMKNIAIAPENEHIIWLGEDENAFIASFNAANTPFQMAIIGLTSNSMDLSEANLLTYLHSELPIHGWSVLNALLPDKKQPVLPMRKIGPGGITPNKELDKTETDQKNSTNPSSASNAVGDEENATADKLEETAQNRIKAAINFLLEQTAQSVTLITNNDNLDRAIQASIANTDSTSGLVLWQIDQSKLNKETLSILKESRISILDVVTGDTPKNQITERKRLFAFAKFIDDYKLIQIPVDHEGEIIGGKRMRSWLTSEFRKF